MSYSEDVATIIADQIARFAKLDLAKLTGHVANLDFWIGEVAHAMAVLDGYPKRFKLLKTTQGKFTGSTLQRVPDTDLVDVRRKLVDATYGFLLRLYNTDLINEQEFRSNCKRLDIGIDPLDLKKHRTRLG